MSAYMVGIPHINAMVALARKYRVIDWFDPWIATYTGRLLIAANRASINARYPDTVDNPTAEPGPVPPVPPASEYLYREPDRRPTPVEGIKIVDCYTYQACEFDGWETSEANRFCARLREALIRAALPELETCDGWEWTHE